MLETIRRVEARLDLMDVGIARMRVSNEALQVELQALKGSTSAFALFKSIHPSILALLLGMLVSSTAFVFNEHVRLDETNISVRRLELVLDRVDEHFSKNDEYTARVTRERDIQISEINKQLAVIVAQTKILQDHGR